MAVGNMFGNSIGESRIGGQLHVPNGLAVVNQLPTQVGGIGGHLAKAQIVHGIAVGSNCHFQVVNVAIRISFAPFESQTVRHCWHIGQVNGTLLPFVICEAVVCNGRKGVAGAVVIGGDVTQLELAFERIQPETDLEFI